MEETRLRAVIREEVVLALRALSIAANDLDMPYETSELDSRALSNIEQAADRAAREYKELCGKADEQRARAAENPFEDKPDAVGPAIRSFVHGEAVNILREVRDAVRVSDDGWAAVASERLTHAADNYERTADE